MSGRGSGRGNFNDLPGTRARHGRRCARRDLTGPLAWTALGHPSCRLERSAASSPYSGATSEGRSSAANSGRVGVCAVTTSGGSWLSTTRFAASRFERLCCVRSCLLERSPPSVSPSSARHAAYSACGRPPPATYAKPRQPTSRPNRKTGNNAAWPRYGRSRRLPAPSQSSRMSGLRAVVRSAWTAPDGAAASTSSRDPAPPHDGGGRCGRWHRSSSRSALASRATSDPCAGGARRPRPRCALRGSRPSAGSLGGRHRGRREAANPPADPSCEGHRATGLELAGPAGTALPVRTVASRWLSTAQPTRWSSLPGTR